MMSLATNTDVIDTRGLTAVPGALGIAFATGAFAVALGVGLRPRHPSFFTALWAALAAALAYLAGVWIGAVGTGADLALATSVIGRLAIGWAAPVVALGGAIAAWGGVAVARTGARPPHWPWEGDDAE
ncbi:hypothetical protein [Microbacterium sp.]|uniref:hypothetical protein n=1 Tax=Microbacterium sp. TaxID=51671 RepID=UPI002D7E9BBA|nr:hypothetical protein [Microbacterium sp.]